MDTAQPPLGDIELTERPRTHLSEQRRTSRKALRLKARILLPNGYELTGQTADISRGGIGFFGPQPVEVGRDCTLVIQIEACGASAELKLVGRVAHCRKQADDCYRVGMQFIRMDEPTAAILCNALR